MPKKPHTRSTSHNKQRRSGIRTLRFPIVAPLRDLRRAKCRLALQEAAALAIEANITRDRVLDDFDELLVATAMEAFPDSVHLAAIVLDVPDRFVSTRWHGLKKEVARRARSGK